MARWIYDAFHRMDENGPTPAALPTLLPDRHKLELFVTVTDFYGYGRQVPYADPNPIHDRRHRHLLAFRFGGDDRRDDFDARLPTAALDLRRADDLLSPASSRRSASRRSRAGSARTVPSTSHGSSSGSSGSTSWRSSSRPRPGSSTAACSTTSRSARRSRRSGSGPPTSRSTGGCSISSPIRASALRPSTRPKPSTLAAALGGLTGLPRVEPILDDLVEVGALNERVRRIRDIIETSWDTVEKRVREIVGPLARDPEDPAAPSSRTSASELDEEARASAGFSYATYVRLKISGVVDRYAETACAVCDFPPDSTHALLARSVLRCWAEEREAVRAGHGHDSRAARVPEGLRPRLRRAAAAVRDRRPQPPLRPRGHGGLSRPRGDRRREGPALGRGRQPCATRCRVRASTRRSSATSTPASPSSRCASSWSAPASTRRSTWTSTASKLDALEVALREHLKQRMSGFTGDLYTSLLQLTEGWNNERRWDLLVRYLGFPFWDVLLYPVQSLSDVGERDHVEIVRISPRDTSRIPVEGDPKRSKLVGAEKGHFGAFLSRPGASRTTSGAAWTVPSASSGSCSTAPPRQTCSAGATRRSARSSTRTSRRCRKPRSSSSTCARRSAPRRACQTGASDLPSKCGPASGERRA